MSCWYNVSAPEDDIVASTRIRLARNLSGIPFPSRMNSEQLEQLKAKVRSAVSESNTPFARTLKYIDMNAVPYVEINAMVERHIISPEFAEKSENRAIILSDDESISIMIGEEDHLRIQVILGGFQLEKAYDIAERLDTLLYDSLHFAFDDELGFLTECPTNLGTGLRASVMLHLPVCESSGEISSLSENISKIGFTVRGMYGEGSRSAASLYQISNQITLGISEKNAIDNLKVITSQLVEKERRARKSLEEINLEDTVYRALGTVKSARKISGQEMMNLISRIKLGTSMGIIKSDKNPFGILIENQPFMIMRRYGQMPPEERDIKRAQALREEFKDSSL